MARGPGVKPLLLDAISGSPIEDAQLGSEGAPETDQEESFQDWVDSLEGEKSGYILRAYRLPMDMKGQIVQNAKSYQMIHLDSWPLDAVPFDTFLQTLKTNYMPLDKPGTVMAVRIMIVKPGLRGVYKNKIITVMKSANTSESIAQEKESVSELLRAISENSERQLNQFQQLLAQANMQRLQQPQVDPMDMVVKLMTVMAGFNKVGAGPVAVGGSPLSGVKEMMETMTMMREFMGDSGGSRDDENSLAGIVKAVAPLAKPVLEIAASSVQQRAALAHQSIAEPTPSPTPVNVKISSTSSQPTQSVVARPPTVDEQRAAHGLPPLNNPQADVVTGVSAIPPQSIAPAQPVQPAGNVMLQYISLVCNMVDSGMTPEAAAQNVLKYVPAESPEEQILLTTVEDPNCVNELSALEPRVNIHSDWFEKFRLAILAEYTEEPEGGQNE